MSYKSLISFAVNNFSQLVGIWTILLHLKLGIGSGNSLIFPKDIPIGTIKNYELDNNIGYYSIEVKLFEDMTSVNHAYVIIPKKIREAKDLLREKDE